jgi:hypothetical protein
MTDDEAQLVEVGVFRHDREAAFLCEAPYLEVVGARQPDRTCVEPG